MPSNLFGGSATRPVRSPEKVKADQDRARQEDRNRTRAARAAGGDSRSIGTIRNR